ncbi:hypothetical protein [Rhizobium leguminosarum]|uniref:hypothetical protein n=1 Tax=Rhizobium leguminosarum TaxID=384 RepID=UPI000DE2F690
MKVTRENLHALVWTKTGKEAAELLGVSGVYLGRVCEALGVPRPPRGWWQKKLVGRASPPVPLPPAKPGHPVEWSKQGHGTPPIWSFDRHRKTWATSRASGMHPLSVEALRIFGRATPARGSRTLWTRSGAAIDLTVSSETLDQGIRAANAFFLALEKRGHFVTVAARQGFIRPQIDCGSDASRDDPPPPTWTPRWPTVAVVDGTAIGVAVMEIQERTEVQYMGDGRFIPIPTARRRRADKVVGITWRQSQWLPTGGLKLVAYSPFHSVPWQRHFVLPRSERENFSTVVVELEESARTLSAPYREAGFP